VRPHVIRHGEYLARLAHLMGFDAQEVWNHASNQELRERRGNPQALHAGDVLQVPVRSERRRLQLTHGQENRFRAAVPRITVRLALTRIDDRPLANRAYRIEDCGPEAIEGTTDGEGVATFELPVHVEVVRVVFPDTHNEMRIRVGHLPAATGRARPIAGTRGTR
jgi:hypothetical protein